MLDFFHVPTKPQPQTLLTVLAQCKASEQQGADLQMKGCMTARAGAGITHALSTCSPDTASSTSSPACTHTCGVSKLHRAAVRIMCLPSDKVAGLSEFSLVAAPHIAYDAGAAGAKHCSCGLARFM